MLPQPSESEWPVLQPRARMLSRSMLLLKALFGSVVQLYLGSVFMSVAHAASGGHRNHA